MFVSGAPSDVRTRLGEPSYRSDLYTRYRISDADRFGQVLVVDGSNVQMRVKASRMVLGVDFRTESLRRDVPGRLRPRPGFRLVDKVNEGRRRATPRLLFNGNNIGYWANQFVVEAGRLWCKNRGPLFDDEKYPEHVTGRFSFFGWSPAGFAVKSYSIKSFCKPDDTGVEVLPAIGSPPLPTWAMSGFPLVQGGLQVWHDHVGEAWDSRLLFDVGRMIYVDHEQVKADLLRRHAAGEPQVRHPITAVGVDGVGNAIIMVVEQSVRSRGLSIAEAAEEMRKLGAVDAVALGAAGDAQLATTEEGFLVAPLVDDHVSSVSPPIADCFRGPDLADLALAARPVPCIASIEPRDPNVDWSAEEQTVMDGKVNRGIRRKKSAGRHRRR